MQKPLAGGVDLICETLLSLGSFRLFSKLDVLLFFRRISSWDCRNCSWLHQEMHGIFNRHALGKVPVNEMKDGGLNRFMGTQFVKTDSEAVFHHRDWRKVLSFFPW
jgi:hypothetical protein